MSMYGLSFKGINSSTFGLIAKSDNRQMLPAVTRPNKAVLGFAGTVDFGIDTYGEKTITVTLQYNYHHNAANMATQAEQIAGWLYDDGTYCNLIFDDQPNRVYYAKCLGPIDLTQGNSAGTMIVAFTCNPPWPFDLNNNPVTPAQIAARLLWDNAANLSGIEYIKDMTADGAFKFTVGGAHNVLPKITLTGNIPSGLQLACNGMYWQYNAALQFDGILIDCAAQTVTRLSDGANLYPNVNSAKAAYFSLAAGQNEIDITGTGGVWPNDLILAVAFTPIQ